jgi:dihydropteroate synthase
MGIVNVTPDSFSDGGKFFDAKRAIEHGLRLHAEGAHVVDVGGESTRPGAAPVGEGEERRRILPVIAGLARAGVPVSVDTTRASVAAAAVEAGASWVNDVSGLDDPDMATLAAQTGVTLVVMHRRGTPRNMQKDTQYQDLLGEVERHLSDRRDRALAAGVRPDRLVLDAGVGFGKHPADNPLLIAATPRWKALGHRVLVGASRKRFIGDLTGVTAAEDRIFGSVGAALAAARWGADIVRVHDVAATRQAWVVYRAIVQENPWIS